MQQSIQRFLTSIGENPTREGLRDTPRRFENSLRFLLQGYEMKLEQEVNGAIFQEQTNGMVVLRDMEFFSLCEHHLLPFFGTVQVGYAPDGNIIGISKIARIVNMFSRRLQIQERLTEQIAVALEDLIKPKGIGVIIEACHFCMMMRGVEKTKTKMVTYSFHGNFTDKAFRDEFFKI